MNLWLLHASWAVAGSGIGLFTPLPGRGSEVDLVMVICTHSRFSGVQGVEVFTGDAGILEVFCGVLGLLLFC